MTSEYPNISKNQFLKEVGIFRQFWSAPGFWQDQQKKDAAVSALATCYFNAKGTTPDEQDSIVSFYQATMNEFMRRDVYIATKAIACRFNAALAQLKG